jgi:hypothetical protein
LAEGDFGRKEKNIRQKRALHYQRISDGVNGAGTLLLGRFLVLLSFAAVF